MAHTLTHARSLLHDTNPPLLIPIEASSPEPGLNSPRCRRRELNPVPTVPPLRTHPPREAFFSRWHFNILLSRSKVGGK